MKKLLIVLILGSAVVSCAHKERHHGKKYGGKSMLMDKKMSMNSAMRANMALMHEKMGICLKSEKSLKECRMAMKSHHKKICLMKARRKDCRMMGMKMEDVKGSHQEVE